MSIQLATPWSINGSLPGVNPETDTHAAQMRTRVDVIAGTVSMDLVLGTATVTDNQTTGFAAGSQSPTVTVTINLFDGQWSSSNGMNGQLTPEQIAGFHTWYASVQNPARNLFENFAASLGVLGEGTVFIPW